MESAGSDLLSAPSVPSEEPHLDVQINSIQPSSTSKTTSTTAAPNPKPQNEPQNDDGRRPVGEHGWLPDDAPPFFIAPPKLPYNTPDSSSGIGGHLKTTPSDFIVVENTPPPPDDKQGYFWVTITRSGKTTLEVQEHFKACLNLKDHKEVGISGLKDKHATTTQTFSVPSYSSSEKRHLTADEVTSLSTPIGEVLSIVPCSKKLRRNYHHSNTFTITLRSACPDPAPKIRSIMQSLSENGVKNYYGPQRFGSHLSGAYTGYKMLKDIQEKKGKQRKKASWQAKKSVKGVFGVQAWQSMLFNCVLANRSSGAIQVGDIVVPSSSASATPGLGDRNGQNPTETRVTGKNFEEIRGDEFVSITCPLPGSRQLKCYPNTPAGKIESEVLKQNDISEQTLADVDAWGSRRVGFLKFQDLKFSFEVLEEKEPRDPSTSDVRFSFTLGTGQYATNVLREFMKNGNEEGDAREVKKEEKKRKRLEAENTEE
ncbi:hypothetical protein TrST_g2806 [Triparma strigata]|uniref:TRUD domain-containing protein n=1 Tax=Triparma strigata TaxID=1606541 RepID=A0A9W7B4X9_9STRA|nr:hypothetical protein TrST_g2806 [Triparma strigata]